MDFIERQSPGLLVADGISLDSRFRDLPARWKTVVYNNLNQIRMLPGYMMRIYSAPYPLSTVIPGKKVNQSQIQMVPGTYIWGVRFVNQSGPTLALARDFSLRIREINKGGLTGANFINAGCFAPGTGSQSNLYIPVVPWFVESGKVNIEIMNTTTTDASCQLALFCLSPEVLPPAQKGRLQDIRYPNPIPAQGTA